MFGSMDNLFHLSNMPLSREPSRKMSTKAVPSEVANEEVVSIESH